MDRQENSISIRLPPAPGRRNGNSKLAVRIDRKRNYHDVLRELAQHAPFFANFLARKGDTEEGPFQIILNGKFVAYGEFLATSVAPGDEVILIPPLLGG